MQKIKPKLFTMKVEPKILARWHQFAKSKNIYLSDVIKKLMSGQELPDDVPIKREINRRYSKVDPQLLREINMIGSNLNQIARGVNQGEKLDVIIHLNIIEKQLEKVLKNVS